MTAPTDARLEIRRMFDATPQEVFEAWTLPQLMQQWLAPGPMTTPRAEVDLRPGGRFRIGMRDPGGTEVVATGVYREIIPGERLVFTWSWEGGDGEETLVTISLASREGGTELVLVHERFATRESRARHLDGWNSCFDKLARVLGHSTGGVR